MSEKKIEKIGIIAEEGGQGYRLVLSWLTGGGGRQTERLADSFATRAEAEARALADHGVAAEPGDATGIA